MLKTALAAALLIPGLAAAQTPGAADDDEWSFLAGPAALVLPEFSGSEDYRVLPVPFFDLRKGDSIIINPYRGAALKVLGDDRWKVYGGLTYSGGRDEDDALPGLDEVEGGVAGFAEIEVFPFQSRELSFTSFRARVERPFTGEVDGAFLELSAQTGVRPSEQLIVTFGVDVEFADEDALGALYGIDPAQAAASSFTPYTLDGGVHSYGATVFGLYELTDRWSLTAAVVYDRLAGDVEDSPVVAEANQFVSILGAAYRF